MTITHVLIPHTTLAACGAKTFYRNAAFREQVDCLLCKNTEHYKSLPNLPRHLRKGKKK